MARDWLKTQSQPSFKGINFFVSTDRIDGGRRIVVHEYPKSEFWDNEDLGRKVFKIDVEAYVVGDDADTQAQNLQAACSSPGAGILILPNRPQQTARNDGCIPIWDADEQGKFKFQLRFIVESRIKGGIVSTVDLASAVARAADDACATVTTDFSAKFNSVSGIFGKIPSISRLAAAASILKVANSLFSLAAQVKMSVDKIAAQVQFGIRQLQENALAFANQVETAIRIDENIFIDAQSDIVSAAGRIINDTLGKIADGVDDAKVFAGALSGLMTIEADPLSSSFGVATVQAEQALTDDVMAFTRRIAIIRYAQAITKSTFVSRSETVSAKAVIAPTFADEIASADTPVVADALRSVSQSAANYLAKNGALLPRTLKIDTARGLPAAVLAAMLYNDASQDEDLWNRNGPWNHPLMLPTSIEVLAPDGF